MASEKSIKKNYIFNLTYQLLLLITPLITTPYVSRVLGADGIGTVSYAESIVSYFVLFATMGITTHGQREISYVQQSIENMIHDKRYVNFVEEQAIQSGVTPRIYVRSDAVRVPYQPSVFAPFFLKSAGVALF